MTGTKRLIAIGLTSVTMVVATVFLAAPAQAKDREACRAALKAYDQSEFAAGLYDMFMIRRPFGLNVLIELNFDDVLAHMLSDRSVFHRRAARRRSHPSRKSSSCRRPATTVSRSAVRTTRPT
jgi:hypothetical protein